MFGAISGALFWDLARKGGAMVQLDLLEPIPMIEIDVKYLSNVYIDYRWQGDGMGITSSQDHPCFTEIRESLGRKGYIEIERGWSNGDHVLKPFYINRYLFEEGDKFCCAGALHYTIKRFMESDEYDRRNPDHFIYGGDFIPKTDLLL